MNTLTIQRRTIAIKKIGDYPRKKKKKLKKAMKISWQESPIDPNWLLTIND